jgi:hypothetical protein
MSQPQRDPNTEVFYNLTISYDTPTTTAGLLTCRSVIDPLGRSARRTRFPLDISLDELAAANERGRMVLIATALAVASTRPSAQQTREFVAAFLAQSMPAEEE